MDFKEIANHLLNSVLLILQPSREGEKAEFRLTEIEFYLFSETHPDPYTHRSLEQKTENRFYFHKFGNGTFKAGTWKGLDLCFGRDSFFGVLIRSLTELKTGKIIEGPCLSVNRILSHFDFENVSDFVSKVFDGDLDFDVYDESKLMHLRKVTHLPHEVLFSGPRIGLSNKFPDYKDLPYRFCICRDKIKKNRKTLKAIETWISQQTLDPFSTRAKRSDPRRSFSPVPWSTRCTNRLKLLSIRASICVRQDDRKIFFSILFCFVLIRWYSPVKIFS